MLGATEGKQCKKLSSDDVESVLFPTDLRLTNNQPTN